MKDVNILVEALPYIKKFHEKKILIKYGGHAMIDEDAMSSTVRDTVLLNMWVWNHLLFMVAVRKYPDLWTS